MKVVALCKTFGGHEWVQAMAYSIYDHVDNIVFVNSDVSWTGARGNKCRGEIEKIEDKQNKIRVLEFDTHNQMAQVMYGYNYIQDKLPCDYVMLIDTDEVWDGNQLIQAKEFLAKNPEKIAYRTRMYTYLKTPFYRVSPVEPLLPVSFVNMKQGNLGGLPRACDLPYIRTTGRNERDIFFHHFVYVRENFNSVLEKIISSHVSEEKNYADMSVWIPEVWNRLPDIDNFYKTKGIHPGIGFAKNWRNLAQVVLADLPEILQTKRFSIMEKFIDEAVADKNLCA